MSVLTMTTVMIVDTDLSYRSLLGCLMTLQGAEVCTVGQAEVALRMLEKRTVRAVLIGACATDTFASSLAGRIRAMQGDRAPLLVALTSTAPERFGRRQTVEVFDLLHERVFDLEGASVLLERLTA